MQMNFGNFLAAFPLRRDEKYRCAIRQMGAHNLTNNAFHCLPYILRLQILPFQKEQTKNHLRLRILIFNSLIVIYGPRSTRYALFGFLSNRTKLIIFFFFQSLTKKKKQTADGVYNNITRIVLCIE